MRAALRDLELAGEADGEAGLAGIDFADELADGVLERGDAIVALPGVGGDHFEFHAASAIENLRSGGHAIAEAALPKLAAAGFFLVDENFDGDRAGGFVFLGRAFGEGQMARFGGGIGRGHVADADAGQFDFVRRRIPEEVGGIGLDLITGFGGVDSGWRGPAVGFDK